MKIIALSGSHDTGKSHTINLVYSLLILDGYNQIENVFESLGNPKQFDCFDILVKNSLRIGIIGMGDYLKGPYSLKNLIEKISKIRCDIIVCACRNDDGFTNIIKKHPNHIIIDKAIPLNDRNERDITKFRIENLKDAKKIIDNLFV